MMGGSDTKRTGLTPVSDFRGSFQFGTRSAKVLMRSDTDGEDNEISEYQLLMKSLASVSCRPKTACECVHCTPLYRG